jgi:hypothetical protein
MFAGAMLEEALLRAIVRGTCQARKPYEQWHLVLGITRSLRRQVEVECHVAICSFGRVAQLQELAAEACNSCFRCHRRHFLKLQHENVVFEGEVELYTMRCLLD